MRDRLVASGFDEIEADMLLTDFNDTKTVEELLYVLVPNDESEGIFDEAGMWRCDGWWESRSGRCCMSY